MRKHRKTVDLYGAVKKPNQNLRKNPFRILQTPSLSKQITSSQTGQSFGWKYLYFYETI
jgi:hypothetical protein